MLMRCDTGRGFVPFVGTGLLKGRIRVCGTGTEITARPDNRVADCGVGVLVKI